MSKRHYILEDKNPKTNQSWGGEKTAFHRTSFWKNLSKGYRIKHPICEDCLEVGMQNLSEETDHIIPVPSWINYPKDMWLFKMMSQYKNLRAKCKPHHSQKTALTKTNNLTIDEIKKQLSELPDRTGDIIKL